MLKVLIAEDDLFMADMLADVLVEAGFDVCGIARTVEEGIELGERCRPDLAVLDVRLAAGGLGTHIAARLKSEGRTGILYATGNGGLAGLTRDDGEACLGKPYRLDDVVNALRIVEQVSRTGKTTESFPKGFRLLKKVPEAVTRSEFADRASAEVRRLRRQQAALAGFGSYALGESDLMKVLTEAARVCAECLEVPFCKVCRYRPEENDLLVEAGVGWNQGIVGRVVSRADQSSPQGRAFVSGQPVICHHLQADSNFVLPAFYAEHGIVSTVDVIIRKPGRPYGVLEIDSAVQHDYDEHDIDFLTGFANVLAEAVDTARRSTALQGAVARMQEMVADRDRMLKAKSIALIEKNTLLDEKSKLLDDKNVLAQELQHRVRNNLQLVYGMVSKQLHMTTDPVGRTGLNGIARRVMTLAQVYDHLLGAGLSRTIDFGGYLTSLCASIKSLQPAQDNEIVLTCHAEHVMLDLDSVTALGLVISELISNSYDHAFSGGRGSISVTLSRGRPDEAATIIFADDGAGFTEDHDSKRHGLGLVRRLMQQVDGSAELQAGPGTRWVLRFPVQRAQAPNRVNGAAN